MFLRPIDLLMASRLRRLPPCVDLVLETAQSASSERQCRTALASHCRILNGLIFISAFDVPGAGAPITGCAEQERAVLNVLPAGLVNLGSTQGGPPVVSGAPGGRAARVYVWAQER